MKKSHKGNKVLQRLHFLSFKVHLTNIRGLHSNLPSVHYHLETEKPHLLFLTETQIKNPADATYLKYPGYSIEYNFKPKAGACVYVRDDICLLRLRQLEEPSFSVLWTMVDMGIHKIVYACVYRSHSGDFETTRLLNYLSEAADEVGSRYPDAELVFLGDFNACHAEWLFPFQKTDHAGRETFNFALTHNLSQLVREATRVPDIEDHTANCLDLLLTTNPDRHTVSVSAPLGSSDHCLVKTVSNYPPPDTTTSYKRRVWKYKLADWEEMRHFFASYPWRQVCFSSADPSSCADNVVDVIRQGMEYFIPFSDVNFDGKAKPWFNSDCITAEKRKLLAYKAWVDARLRKAPDLRSKKRAFNKAAKYSKKVIRKARFDRIQNIGRKLISYPSGSKAFWSLAKIVESNFCRPSLPPLLKSDGSLAHSAKEKADLLASLFANNSRLDSGNKCPPVIPHSGSYMSSINVTQKTVLKTLRNLDVNKASGPDGLPAIVFKNCAPELSPVLTRLFRLSLKSGIVPKSWKVANVQPVPKKGSRAEPTNYRPISITSILSKIMERILNEQLLAHLEANDLLTTAFTVFAKRGRLAIF
ncbi:uncharacterized protein LOC123706298 [Colias croceus]|uniref:uncharacterized protein LOC123706298 n=1 Tax=Colias crocea TaxID=72248 RepID=UPI001E27A881|nr:uncharacterized protein LOC123706298 [Colias croceus]